MPGIPKKMQLSAKDQGIPPQNSPRTSTVMEGSFKAAESSMDPTTLHTYKTNGQVEKPTTDKRKSEGQNLLQTLEVLKTPKPGPPVVQLQPFHPRQWLPSTSLPDAPELQSNAVPKDIKDTKHQAQDVDETSPRRSTYYLPNGYPRPDKIVTPRVGDEICQKMYFIGGDKRTPHPKITREVTMPLRETSFIPQVERQKSTVHDISTARYKAPQRKPSRAPASTGNTRPLSKSKLATGLRQSMAVSGNKFRENELQKQNTFYMATWEMYKMSSAAGGATNSQADLLETLQARASSIEDCYLDENVYDAFDRSKTLTSFTVRAAAPRQPSASSNASRANSAKKVRRPRRSARYGATPGYRLGVINSLDVMGMKGKPSVVEQMLSENLKSTLTKLKSTKDASFLEADMFPNTRQTCARLDYAKTRNYQKSRSAGAAASISGNNKPESRNYSRTTFRNTPSPTKAKDARTTMAYTETELFLLPTDRQASRIRRGRAPLHDYTPDPDGDRDFDTKAKATVYRHSTKGSVKSRGSNSSSTSPTKKERSSSVKFSEKDFSSGEGSEFDSLSLNKDQPRDSRVKFEEQPARETEEERVSARVIAPVRAPVSAPDTTEEVASDAQVEELRKDVNLDTENFEAHDAGEEAENRQKEDLASPVNNHDTVQADVTRASKQSSLFGSDDDYDDDGDDDFGSSITSSDEDKELTAGDQKEEAVQPHVEPAIESQEQDVIPDETPPEEEPVLPVAGVLPSTDIPAQEDVQPQSARVDESTGQVEVAF